MAAVRHWRSTRPAVVTALLGLVVAAGFGVVPGPSPRPAAPPGASVAHDVLASLPLAFEPAGDAGFVSRGPGYSLALTPAEAALAVDGGSFRMRPAGPVSNPAARLVGRDPLPGTVTRLQGDDARTWTAGVPTYGAVVAHEVWPGVDMVWHGNQRRLEHDMVVAPGVDPSVVALDVEGSTGLSVDGAGDLVIDLGGPSTRMAAPVLYQDGAGGRRFVDGSFALLGASRIGFEVGDYDRSLPLVIDPTLIASTYLGGSGADSGYGIARDRAGNTYVVGSTESSDFPTASPFQSALAPTTGAGPSTTAAGSSSTTSAPAAAGPSTDVFVAKLDPTGSALVWSTYLGGRGRDTGYGIGVGSDGAVYVAGVTESDDFPRAKAAQQNYGGGASDAFVAKIAPAGTGLEWSTFLGGSETDRARGLALDPAGSAYITGSTSSVNFPGIVPQQPGPFRPDDVDAFVAKIPAVGGGVEYSTRLGGGNDDHGLAIAVDAQGSAFVTGDTLSPGFPTVRPFQAGSGGSASGVAGSFPDAFVAKYTPTGSALVYSTFLGGSDFDQATAIAVDTLGGAYVTGNTRSPNFPTSAPLQARKDGDTDAFVAKLDPPGAGLVFSTYYGGAGADGGNGIAVDQTGNAVVVGTTGSANLVMTRAVQAAKSGGSDAFVLRLNAAGSSPLFSSFLGGRDEDQAMAVAFDARGEVQVLGFTSSPDFPTVKPIQAARSATAADAFLTNVSLADASAPPAQTAAAPAASTGHDRRVRALGILTLVLLAAAVAQTFYLRRRTPTPAPAGPARSRAGAGAQPGVKVLPDDTKVMAGSGAGAKGRSGATSSGAEAKAGASTAGAAAASKGAASKGAATAGSASAASAKAAASKAARAPKARGGPKGQPTGGRPPKGAATPPPPPITFPGLPDDDDGGPPTVAMPPIAPPRPAPPVHEPAIAQLLEEDIWRPDPSPAKPMPPGDWERLADDRSGEVEAVRVDDETQAVPTIGPPSPPNPPVPNAEPPSPPTPPAAPPAIPPLPAQDLSFWDLFPEDLPPARAGGFQVDEMVDNPALPPAQDLSPATPPPSGPPPPPGPPPEAEIVIAELLDGPAPAGRREKADAEWAPEKAGGDFLVSDLLADEPDSGEDEAGRDDEAEDPAGAAAGRSPEEQARIAADRARRRRNSRRGGGRRPRAGPGNPG